MDTHLGAHLLHRIGLHLIRDVAVADEEIRLRVAVQDLHVLVAAVHGRAGVHARKGVQELVATLDRTLKQRSGVLAGVVGHVVGSDVDAARARCADAHREALVHVAEHFRHVVAGIADRQSSFLLRLPDERIVGVLQQVFKFDQVFEIFHRTSLPKNIRSVMFSHSLSLRIPPGALIAQKASLSASGSAARLLVRAKLSQRRKKPLRKFRRSRSPGAEARSRIYSYFAHSCSPGT